MTKMTILKRSQMLAAVLGGMMIGLGTANTVVADELAAFKVGDKHSGYVYTAKETRELQDDDFENPAMLWVEEGEALWSKAGPNGKSCASCHEDAAATMKGVGAAYPKYDAKSKKMINLEQIINREFVEKTGGKSLKWESKPLLALTAFVSVQSRGMPLAVKTDGEAAPFLAKGKAFFYQRRGQLDMACKHCHEDNAGNMIRADLLSQGQANGFPTYRLKWQKIGSLHRRFRGCNKNIRAQPFKAGSDEYVNLELYVKSRGAGLKMEAPSVRR